MKVHIKSNVHPILPTLHTIIINFKNDIRKGHDYSSMKLQTEDYNQHCVTNH